MYEKQQFWIVVQILAKRVRLALRDGLTSCTVFCTKELFCRRKFEIELRFSQWKEIAICFIKLSTRENFAKSSKDFYINQLPLGVAELPPGVAELPPGVEDLPPGGSSDVSEFEL